MFGIRIGWGNVDRETEELMRPFMPVLAPKPGIMDISLYQGGESHVDGASRVLKLSSNENPFGPSRVAIDAIASAGLVAHRYPPTDHARLRTRIGAVHGLDPERIIVGVGSDEVLTLLALAYAGVGDEVVYPEHGFLLYPTIARSVGATPVAASESDRCVDVDALLRAITAKTRLIYLANPANPTGTMVHTESLAWLVEKVPTHCLLVLDGAYSEFVDNFDGGAGFVEARSNVVMTRTFSKIYGLGGLRVGWGYGPAEVIDVLNRIRGPFNMSGVALAGAEAALSDQKYVAHCRTMNQTRRKRLCDEVRQLDLECDESFANFVLVRFADESVAKAAYDFLKSQYILVRRVDFYGFPEGLRITVGTSEEIEALLSALRLFQEKT